MNVIWFIVGLIIGVGATAFLYSIKVQNEKAKATHYLRGLIYAQRELKQVKEDLNDGKERS
ncbi:MAG: hypothetical protein HOG49_01055 [Candidatus Scalindua sp.]|jgi:hypothetical protein|nr:hypothetical protein [Candidatus Scalindua sp.]